MKLFYLLLILLTLTSCRYESNSDIVVKVLKSFENGDITTWEEYVDKNYIQHNSAFPDGRATMVETISMLKNIDTKVETLLIFEDGDYVVALDYSDLKIVRNLAINIFRLENGIIVEHWDNVEKVDVNYLKDFKFSNSSKRQNIKKVKLATNYLESFEKSYLSESFENISSENDKRLIKEYGEIKFTFNQGDYVLVVSKGKVKSMDYAFYDLFKISGNMIENQLSVSESIPDEKHWKNSNGKF